jgi:hypothetical protein
MGNRWTNRRVLTQDEKDNIISLYSIPIGINAITKRTGIYKQLICDVLNEAGISTGRFHTAKVKKKKFQEIFEFWKKTDDDILGTMKHFDLTVDYVLRALSTFGAKSKWHRRLTTTIEKQMAKNFETIDPDDDESVKMLIKSVSINFRTSERRVKRALFYFWPNYESWLSNCEPLCSCDDVMELRGTVKKCVFCGTSDHNDDPLKCARDALSTIPRKYRFES